MEEEVENYGRVEDQIPPNGRQRKPKMRNRLRAGETPRFAWNRGKSTPAVQTSYGVSFFVVPPFLSFLFRLTARPLLSEFSVVSRGVSRLSKLFPIHEPRLYCNLDTNKVHGPVPRYRDTTARW